VSILLAWLLITYGLATLWLLLGIYRQSPGIDQLPKISVVICLRNEESALPGLLDALNHLDYPQDRLEIVLVNDRSTDNTEKLLHQFQTKSQFPVVLVTLDTEVPGYPGKMGALIRGLNQASGDIFALTDADTGPHPEWIRCLVSHFEEDVGVVAGPIRITGKGLWSRLQALDWTYLFAAGSGAAGWGHPQSIFGKNAAIRAATYNQIGTLQAVPFSVTEDLALTAAVRDRTKWKIRLPMDETLTLDATPAPNLKTLWHQRRRWALGGISLPVVGRLLIALMMIMSLVIIVSLFVNPAWAIGLFILQCLLDFPLIASALGRIGRSSWLIYWPLYRAAFIILLIPLITSFLFSRSIHWKGDIHR
jgi:1,2-diacylglycerol 3-beta-glucosyltransferase